jgi:hypothetical protein
VPLGVKQVISDLLSTGDRNLGVVLLDHILQVLLLQ